MRCVCGFLLGAMVKKGRCRTCGTYMGIKLGRGEMRWTWEESMATSIANKYSEYKIILTSCMSASRIHPRPFQKASTSHPSLYKVNTYVIIAGTRNRKCISLYLVSITITATS